MLKNYLLIAYRNILRNKLRTFVHIIGLSLGIAVSFLVFQLVWFEYSFDRFHPDADRTYQVNTLSKYLDGSWLNGGVPVPLAAVIQEKVPEIERMAQFYTLWEVKVFEATENRLYQNGNKAILTDSGFFDLFPRKWLAGNPGTALREVNQVVLTASAAQRYFSGMPYHEIMGKELTYFFNDTIQADVVGVVADFEEKTDIKFTDFLAIGNMSDQKDFYQTENWNSVNSSSQLFVRLYAGGQVEQASAKLLNLADQYLNEEEDGSMEFSLLPLSELHFHDNFDNPGANKMVLNGLMVIAVFILTLAGLNFINLETARSMIRAKEVGIRKTLGSSRPQLIFQFLAETGLIVVFSMVVGMFLSKMLSQYFAGFLPNDLRLQYAAFPTLIFLLVLGIFLTTVSGIFPALVLSWYQPQRVMKKDYVNFSGFSIGYFIRKNLMVFQFALSIAFVISVLVVSNQINFLMKKDLGFDKEQVMHLRIPYNQSQEKKESFKASLTQQSFVQQVSMGNDALASSGLLTTYAEVEKNGNNVEMEVQVKTIDSHFLGVYKVNLLSGRNIRNVPGEMLVNQGFLREMGFGNPADALGLALNVNDKEQVIVGVTPDFHSRTLRENIRPMVMFYRPENSSVISLRLNGNADLEQAKSTLDGISKSFFPDDQLAFQFFDETIGALYQFEIRLQKILGMATVMALVISFLGLFALTSFTIAQKTKEMSIRKVLGASLSELIAGLSKEYVLLIGIAFVLGAAPAWYFLGHWLGDFQYRINMPYGLYLLAGLFALLATLGIVGLHTYQIAQKNPAEVLSSE
ncbi:FtsX-like permease family protein [Cyclobacterium sp.]|uniref:ABC transporter permease n=1 Tax=Cyclobacterium sp. TaxID=1966343 RepID=UPI0019C3A090|nr:FtsX-like permease family protein [Cyclobacterium sp.]MBD3630159.1 ABC transporter permease [Cyclobacterium sp.]